MATLFAARSATLSQWGSDVGLSKHIYKVGATDRPIKELIAAGWAGDADWVLIKKQEGVDLTEDAIVERLARKAKLIDPALYPRIKGTAGLFKVLPTHVENHLLMVRALAGDQLREIKIKPADFGTYLLAGATS
jgi:hypothetical protein